MRRADWQSRLAELVAARMDAPFAWGSNDCCLFAADAVLAVTGTDPAADLRGAYTDERGALRVLARLGGVAGIAEARAGAEIVPALARPGDIVLGAIDRECLGVCTGLHWHAPSAAGLVCAPMSAALRAWRV
jgi:hypothetical protein